MADLLDLIANLPQQESKGVTTPKFKNYKPMDSNFEQIKVT